MSFDKHTSHEFSLQTTLQNKIEKEYELFQNNLSEERAYIDSLTFDEIAKELYIKTMLKNKAANFIVNLNEEWGYWLSEKDNILDHIWSTYICSTSESNTWSGAALGSQKTFKIYTSRDTGVWIDYLTVAYEDYLKNTVYIRNYIKIHKEFNEYLKNSTVVNDNGAKYIKVDEIDNYIKIKNALLYFNKRKDDMDFQKQLDKEESAIKYISDIIRGTECIQFLK